MAQIKLGELLVRANVLQEGQLRAALAEQHRWGGKLGETLVRMGVLTEDLLVKALSKQLGLPTVNLEGVQELPEPVRAKIPTATARDQAVLPLQLRDEGRSLVVVMADPLNLELQGDLRAMTGCRILVTLAGRTAIQRAFTRLYGREALVPDEEESFGVLDSLGRPLLQVAPEPARAAVAPPPAPAPGARSQAAPPARAQAPSAGGLSQVLRSVEDLQRREATALRAMVELLVEKGVFTRDEFLAKVRR